jgi:hypothetical protein
VLNPPVQLIFILSLVHPSIFFLSPHSIKARKGQLCCSEIQGTEQSQKILQVTQGVDRNSHAQPRGKCHCLAEGFVLWYEPHKAFVHCLIFWGTHIVVTFLQVLFGDEFLNYVDTL